MKRFFLLSWVVFLLLSSIACNKQKGAGNKNTNLLPSSSGGQGEILAMIDSSNWNGPLGKSLRNVLMDTFPGLARPEPFFDVRRVPPGNMDDVFKRHRNLIFVSTIRGSERLPETSNYFNEASIKKIRENPRFFMYKQTNQYAHPQNLIHLFGTDKGKLIQNLQRYGEQLKKTFISLERAHILRRINKKPKATKTINVLKEQFNIALTLPEGFKVAKKNRNFIWLRDPEDYADYNIMISRQPYYSQKQFNKNHLINWRDSLGRNHIFGSGKKDTTTYLTTQDYIPVQTDTLTFQGKYARQLRGLWKLKDNTMGGSFISYAFAGNNNKSLYYLEGFIYAHGNTPDMREKIRKTDVILNTFSIQNN